MRFALTAGTGFSLGPMIARRRREFQRAALEATDRASRGALDEFRTAMRGQRLGGYANVIKQVSDLKKGGRVHQRASGGWSASGIIFPNIRNEREAGALAAYGEGTTILPKKGRWLAIPTDAIPKRAGRRRMTPQLYRDRGFESRIGELNFVPTRKGNIAFLVVRNTSLHPLRARSARRLPKSGRPRGGRVEASVIAFILIRVTTRSKRIDIKQIAAKWAQRLPRFMQAALG